MSQNFKDIDQIKKNIEMIIRIRDTTNIQIIKKHSIEKYKETMKSIFPIFANEYATIFKLILNNDDLSKLYYMIDSINQIKKGRDKDIVEKEIGEKLAEEYLYPIVGKPDK